METLSRTRALETYNAYHGRGGYLDGSYLDRFGRETAANYADRQGVAQYDNQLKPACSRYAGYLAMAPASRQTDNPLMQAVLENCNGAGVGIGPWMISAAQEFKPYGYGLALVDMPDIEVPASLQQQIEVGAIPRLSRIEPATVTAYSIDEVGLITAVAIEQMEYHDGIAKTVKRSWSQTEWATYIGDILVSSGPVIGGKCPVVPFSESEFPLDGEFSSVVGLSKRLYNLESELDQVIRNQTFSILHYQIPAERDINMINEVAQSVGVHNMLAYYGNNEPGYASPESDPAEVIAARVKDKRDRIAEITHTVAQDSAVPQSGVSRAIKFQELNSSLSSYAGKMEDFERRIFDVMAGVLGLPEGAVQVSWERDYAIADEEAEMDSLERMQANGFPEAAITEKKRRLIDLLLPGMDEELAAAVDQQLNEQDQAV